jgi:hypothetical protein
MKYLRYALLSLVSAATLSQCSVKSDEVRASFEYQTIKGTKYVADQSKYVILDTVNRIAKIYSKEKGGRIQELPGQPYDVEPNFQNNRTYCINGENWEYTGNKGILYTFNYNNLVTSDGTPGPVDIVTGSCASDVGTQIFILENYATAGFSGSPCDTGGISLNGAASPNGPNNGKQYAVLVFRNPGVTGGTIRTTIYASPQIIGTGCTDLW